MSAGQHPSSPAPGSRLLDRGPGATTSTAAPGGPAGAERPDSAPHGPAPHLAYNPALDGIRGLAVAAVLLFHGGFSWAQGGYLGVSTFFTLSGFLITTLLLREHATAGTLRLRRFWAKRMRRLMPASLLTLAVLLLSVFVTAEGWERELPWDAVASLAQVANWRFLLDDRAYAALFDLPSPALHFWSLAIEEQFYWLFPLFTLGILKLARGSLRAFALALGGLLAVAAVATLLASGTTTAYYATHIRMGEIVMGALLAVAVTADRGRLLGDGRVGRLATGAGALALVASLWAWWQVGQDSPALADGGLLLYALVSAALVLAACVDGPVRRLLSVPPLRALGVVSYGVYLFHWPIFLFLDKSRVDDLLAPFNLNPRGWNLFGIRLAVTLMVAVASFYLLEQPIREGRRPVRVRAPALVAGAAAAILILAAVVPRISPPPEDVFVRSEQSLRETASAAAQDSDSEATVGVALGDSTMLMTALGLSVWGNETGRLVLTPGAGGIGCGIVRGGDIEHAGEVGSRRAACGDWETQLPEAVAEARDQYPGRVRFAVAQTSTWDVANRRLDGDRWLRMGDPAYEEYLRSELAGATDLLIEEGLAVIWLTAPYVETDRRDGPGSGTYPEQEPERMDLLNRVIRQLAVARPEVQVIDLAGWVNALPEDKDAELRPDGLHFEEESSAEVATWLGPEILDAVREMPKPPRQGTGQDIP